MNSLNFIIEPRCAKKVSLEHVSAEQRMPRTACESVQSDQDIPSALTGSLHYRMYRRIANAHFADSDES